MTAIGYVESPEDVYGGGRGDKWQNIQVREQGIADIGHKYYFNIGSNSSQRTKSPSTKRREVIDWLSSMNFRERYADILRKWQPGTAEWFLSSKEFQDWATGAQRLLWCPGIPGAGKSVISTRVIHHLTTRYEGKGVGVVFIFCDHKLERKNQTAENFISGLTRQLLQGHKTLPPKVAASYDTHIDNQTRPNLAECCELLEAAVKSLGLSKIFIVIDALDECPERIGRDVIQALVSFKPVQAHLLVTSRLEPRIKRLCGDWPTINIIGQDQDIETYIDAHIEDEGELAHVVEEDFDFRTTVIRTIVQRAQGMFLLAERHLASLVNYDNPEDIMAALETLPETLFDSYDETWRRIEQDSRSARVKQILSWISYSPRPLKVKELQHALAVITGSKAINPRRLPVVDTLPSACLGLVVIDRTGGVIRMVHKSTEDYFLERRNQYFPAAQRSIAEACLTYLTFDAFQNTECNSEEGLESLLRDENCALLEYAAKNWGLHAYGDGDGAIERDIQESIQQFLQGATMFCAAQVMLIPGFRLPGYRKHLAMDVTKLHIAAHFGLTFSMECCSESNNSQLCLDPRDSHGRTPLSWAAEKGFTGMVDLLLRSERVDVNSQDNLGRSPLSWAAERGQYPVIQRLLEQTETEVNCQDKHNITPLSLAAQNGHTMAVGLLLSCPTVDPDASDTYRQTPLSWAAGNGHDAVVKQLLQSGRVKINSQSNYLRTPLSWASSNGHAGVVRLLLADEDILPDLGDQYNRTPLYFAASYGRTSVAELLLKTGKVNANSKTVWDTTPLSVARSEGHGDVADLLIVMGKVPNDLKNLGPAQEPEQPPDPSNRPDFYSFTIDDGPARSRGFLPTERQTLRPDDRWEVTNESSRLVVGAGWGAGVAYTNPNGFMFVMALGIDKGSKWSAIASGMENETLEDVINSYYPSVRPKVLRSESREDQVTTDIAPGIIVTLSFSRDPARDRSYLVQVGIR
ncbi:hypothetical protein BJX65DRAFT_57583 [Aspergillus insuetus]